MGIIGAYIGLAVGLKTVEMVSKKSKKISKKKNKYSLLTD
jgi:hypothetical protein